jgi:hypothetical protein
MALYGMGADRSMLRVVVQQVDRGWRVSEILVPSKRRPKVELARGSGRSLGCLLFSFAPSGGRIDIRA